MSNVNGKRNGTDRFLTSLHLGMAPLLPLSCGIGGMSLRPGMEEAFMNADEKRLSEMGYTQELSRRMGAFSNFAISFSIICVLAGGITAFPSALGAGGGISIGIGWPVGAIFALVVAAAMAQIASSFPSQENVFHLVVAMSVALVVAWWAGVRNIFKGPPKMDVG